MTRPVAMPLVSFSESDAWKLVYPDQDVRGWDVRGPADRSFGTVSDFIVDTERQEVQSLLTDAGRRFPVRALRFGDRVVRFEHTRSEEGASDVVKEFGQPMRVVPKEEVTPGEVAEQFEDVYREHFRKTYGGTAAEFEAYAPAYAFGRAYAMQAHYRGRTYPESREDLRVLFAGRPHEVDYDDVEEAIRFAFEHTQRLVT